MSEVLASRAYGETIFCMFNGEYGMHGLDELGITKQQINQTLEIQKKSYEKYIGIDYGDFRCEKIEYDWFYHWPVWTVRCNLCGAVTKIENGYQWSRGKTRSMRCRCRKEQKASDREAELRRIAENRSRIEQELNNEIGKLYGNYEIIECNGLGDRNCVVRCTKCGAIRKTNGINKLRKGIFQKCNCGLTNYSDPGLIGTRNGHCVFTGMNGMYAHLLCDCGRERDVSATKFFKYKAYGDCGNSECEYASSAERKARISHSNGYEFEERTKSLLVLNGYSVKGVGKSGDYGVDIIATRKDGLKIAVQCKCNISCSVGVHAIQEVYAGGRYYDVEHFAVVSYNGVSKSGIKMAKKLGVYISDGTSFDYPDDYVKYADGLIPTVKVQTHETARKLYLLNGEYKTLDDWAYVLGKNADYIRQGLKRGLTFETAIQYLPGKKHKKYVVNGVEGTIAQLCDHFKIVTAEAARYRIAKGESVESAVLTRPRTSGRPKK